MSLHLNVLYFANDRIWAETVNSYLKSDILVKWRWPCIIRALLGNEISGFFERKGSYSVKIISAVIGCLGGGDRHLIKRRVERFCSGL